MKFFKNRFLFIMLISVVTLTLIVIGAISLYKDNSSVFEGDGYIIETTSKTNNKYYFSANTKYKENVDEKIAFSDKDSKKRAVLPASFVHYNNGNIAFLQKGALVNLSELSNPMVTYYNITNENVVVSEDNGYVVSSNGKTIHIDSFIGRISDDKYIVASDKLSLKIPKINDRIDGDYFEILFIEEGIVKIDNKDNSYQVTAQDSYIYVGDDITINLGEGKIYYKGEPKMLLSQITINGDENIDLDVIKNNGTGGGGTGDGTGGDGTGTGTGDGTGSGGTGTGDGTGSGTGSGTGGGGTGDGTGGDGTGSGTGDGSGGSGGSGGNGGDNTTASPQIELIDAKVTATSIDLSLQLNNAALASGDIIYYLTNVTTGQRVEATNNKIDLVNGTFNISRHSLVPSTEYVLMIGELNVQNGKQYFQKIFKTDDLGIGLEKVYATDNSLSYRVHFDENTEVNIVRVAIYDSNGENAKIEDNVFNVLKNDLSHDVVFEGLDSNTNYSVSIDMVWINNAAYPNIYPISRIDSTLKKTPVLSGVKVEANSEEVKFTISLDNVKDPDRAIVNYVYNIYKADDIKVDNLNPPVIYSVVKNDDDALVLDLNEILELKPGVDYRAKIVAQYDDNEMIRESSTDYSSNFLIKSRPNITFDVKSISMNKVSGVLNLIDANCGVPIKGRSCLNSDNTFTLRYYKMKDSETTLNDKVINFSPSKLTSDITIDELSSNTTYAMKVFGSYYDDNGIIHENVQLGDTLYFTTDKSENLHLDVIGDNISGKNKNGTVNMSNVVTFDARLSAPNDSDIMNEIHSITLNLYSGRFNNKDMLIGTYKMTNREEILDFFDNITITNNLFTDVTSFNVGKLNSLANLIKVTNNSTNSLNSDYTVEVADVYDDGGVNEFKVDDNIYTFHLTNSYYLDSRIESNPTGTYITAVPILKKNLTEDEMAELSRTIPNLELLNDDTVVGITVENSLSDMFVDSAYTYEKVVVQYTVYNNATKKMATTYDWDMGNKYQPKAKIIYLDPSEVDDGSHFTRGYNYKIGYNLNFTFKDGGTSTYTNDKLYKELSIERQSPIYTQFISKSTDSTITYRYVMNDIDGALADNNFYYKLGVNGEYKAVNGALISDGEEHDVVLPIGDRAHYELAYARMDTSNELEYVSIADYNFEKEYSYEEQVSFHIVDDNDNVLKLRLENNDITARAVVYRVHIESSDKQVSNYDIYFLASKLSSVSVDTGTLDEDGEKIFENYKYISVDYANIVKFMKHEMVVSLYAYFDSGLVGINQSFNDGLILKSDKKFLNVYNGDVNFKSYANADDVAMGLYLFKNPYQDGSDTFSIYNKLLNVSTYNPFKGANFYDLDNIPNEIGINFKVSATNGGIVYTSGNTDYSGYYAKALKEANLVTDNNKALFNIIVPSVSVGTTGTINSLKISMRAKGIYGDSQFVKDGESHRKVYITFYSDEDKQNKLDTITSDVNITGNDDSGYSATINNIIYENLEPNTTYYFTVNAYIDGKYTQLYDSNDSTKSYVANTYVGKTLNEKDIISHIKFWVAPDAYNGESSRKKLTWRLGLKNTENYRIRFELYARDGVLESNEEGTTYKYKAVSFDGKNAVSCDKLSNGVSANGYVSDCYINVDKNNVSSINSVDQVYRFTGDDFVFGDGYYKLVVYAIPYTNGEYVEDKKLTLYQNDELSTTGVVTVSGLTYDIKIPSLEAVTFDLKNTLDSGYDSNERSYYLEFTPTIDDKHFVMKYGKYTITLRDEKRSIVNGCKAFIRDTSHNFSSGEELSTCQITVDNETNAKFKFTGLSSNTLYYVDLSYQTYRNNVSFTEEEKVNVVPFTDFIYTPIASDITLGTVTAGLVNNKSVMLTYNGSTNLIKNIIGIDYTISLKGASNKVSGSYLLGNGVNEIFTVVSGGLPRFTIDVSDENISSNTAFRFQSGNTYIITTQYYYLQDGVKIILEDQQTHNTNFTTILNL